MIDIFAISGSDAAHLCTDVAGKPIVPIFEGKMDPLGCPEALEYGIDKLP
jgi:hypothetical protein